MLQSLLGDTRTCDAFSHQPFTFLQSLPPSLPPYMVIFCSASMPARSGRRNMAFRWLNCKELGYRDLVVGERLGCRNSVMRDLFVTDLVTRSSVVKGSVVKESLVETWTCSFATIQIIPPCYFSAGSEPRSRRCGWRL